jgi:hypothetical protein
MQLFIVHARENAVMELIPFSIEFISSASNLSSNTYGINQILLDVTTDHLNDFIANRKQTPWDSLTGAILLKYPKSRFTKIDDEQEKQQQQGDGLQILTTQFSGSVSFDNDLTLPTREDLGNVQWEAFIGQAKLDYITSLRSQTSFDFLQNVTDIKISWTPTSSSSSVGTILLATLVGILSAGVIVGVFLFIQRFRANPNASGNVQQHKRKPPKTIKLRNGNHKRNDFHDLELAPTGSLSPTSLEGDFAPTYVDETDSIRMGRSFMTKDTIDVDTGVDMLAWKHRAMRQPEPFEVDITRISKSDGPSILVSKEGRMSGDNSHDKLTPSWKKGGDAAAPFDADITRISKVSPNKTLVIDLRPMRKGSKSKNSSSLREKSSSKTVKDEENAGGYLTKEVLSQHNQIKFQEHARRYAERKKKMSGGGSKLR